MDSLDRLVDQYWETILKDRRWLHAHPELSGQEKQTAAYIAAALREIGLEPAEGIGGYGVVALIRGREGGKCVGLRADFDALAVTEQTDLPFASENPGVMHACGHDMHTAMLLGAARILYDRRDRFCGSVKLIFQPAEEKAVGPEGKSGAGYMIDAGVLRNPPVDAMLGQHLDAVLPTGSIIFKAGAMTAASDRFSITVRGKGSHASKPDQGVDAIAAAAQIISALQTVVARNVSPLDCAVVTVGKINGGTADNILAETVEMTGTCRSHTPAVRNTLEKRMEEIIKGVSGGMGADYAFEYRRGNPPVVNHEELYALVREAALEEIGPEHVLLLDRPSLGAEDFALYGEQVPAAFYRLGSLKEGETAWPLHSGHFAPDENAMRIGIRVLTAAALRFLERE